MKLFRIGILLLLALSIAACTASPVRVAQLEALTDIAMGIPQQDVYVEKDDGMIYRVHQDDLTDEISGQTVYATTENNWPDLFESSDNPRGPYPKGEELGFTFGDWIGATGSAQYIKHANGTDEAHLSFQNLRPDGIYTLWCVLTWLPPNEGAFELPCGSPDGSQASFEADADGNLDAHIIMSAMPYATDEMLSGLCLAYHSDGETHGHVVGEYGKNAHVHLCIDVPMEDSELWEMKSMVSAAGM